MKADELIRQGDLEGALKQLQQETRDNPADLGKRMFLFQLFAVLGDWERAERQLQIMADMDAESMPLAQIYKRLVACERRRAEVFAGQGSPVIFGEPQNWNAAMLESLRQVAAGHLAEAAKLRDQALEEAPATSGHLEVAAGDGQQRVSFEWIADADTRLGPHLELFFMGEYYWVPFQRLHEIHLNPPADLRDLVWMPVKIEWANEGQAAGFVPLRYPGTEAQDDPKLRLSRLTQFAAPADNEQWGLGQRLLATDQADYPLAEIRTLSIDPVDDA